MMLRAVMVRTAFFSVLWWLLTGGKTGSLAVGMVTIVLAVGLSLWLRGPTPSRVSLTKLPRFMTFFLLQSLKAGVQVAALALRPRLDLHPAMLEIELHLPEENARVFLVNTLSLLPGTLSTALHGTCLQLHVLDFRLPLEQEIRQAEIQVARLFRIEP